MNNLFDMIRAAQGGTGLDAMARQFGLQQQQMNSAVEALLPAFSMGLQRQMQNPMQMMEMMGKAFQGNYAQMFDAGAAPAETKAAGDDILSSLFGSKELSRAVAAQASAASGISSAIMKSLLPAIATMIMGAFAKMMGGQGGLGGILGQMMGGAAPQQANAAPGGGLGDLLGGMFGGAQGQQQNPAGPLGDLLGQMMGGAKPQAGAPGGGLGDLLGGMLGGAQGQAQNPAGGGLGDLLGQMMGGAAGQPGSNPMIDMFGKMLDHGTKVQQTNLDGLSSIFDQFMGKK
jgi:hypothetical protein